MKVLSAVDMEMVSGGAVCDGLSLSECIKDVGTTATQEIGNFFSGLNALGSSLGIWLYNSTHSC